MEYRRPLKPYSNKIKVCFQLGNWLNGDKTLIVLSVRDYNKFWSGNLANEQGTYWLIAILLICRLEITYNILFTACVGRWYSWLNKTTLLIIMKGIIDIWWYRLLNKLSNPSWVLHWKMAVIYKLFEFHITTIMKCPSYTAFSDC